MRSPSEWVDALRGGDRSALGRAITLVESRSGSDASEGRALIEDCLPLSGCALRLGVTGIPGVGKSTLIDSLGLWFIEQGHRVAVLAIDPSSARSGGSILGDKTRMERLALREEAFIRPSPAGGMLGGVARRTRETILLCEAAGYDRIIIETVGTGQNEMDADHLTDLNLLLLIAGAGDELQGFKRGIMESADLIAFTKCEDDVARRSASARQDLLGALQLLPPRMSGRRPEVLLTSALSGEGIPGLGAYLESMHTLDRGSGFLGAKRNEQSVHWLDQAISNGLIEQFSADERVSASMAKFRDAVRAGTMTPFAAAEQLLALFRTGVAPRP